MRSKGKWKSSSLSQVSGSPAVWTDLALPHRCKLHKLSNSARCLGDDRVGYERGKRHPSVAAGDSGKGKPASVKIPLGFTPTTVGPNDRTGCRWQRTRLKARRERGEIGNRKQVERGRGGRGSSRELNKAEHSWKLQSPVSHGHFCLMSLTLPQTMYTFLPGRPLPLSEESCRRQ